MYIFDWDVFMNTGIPNAIVLVLFLFGFLNLVCSDLEVKIFPSNKGKFDWYEGLDPPLLIPSGENLYGDRAIHKTQPVSYITISPEATLTAGRSIRIGSDMLDPLIWDVPRDKPRPPAGRSSFNELFD